MPFELSEIIFCVWCLPVAVFIVLPLSMLVSWWMKKMVVQAKR